MATKTTKGVQGRTKTGKVPNAAQLNGKIYEDFLVKKLNGKESFKVGGREFDGAIGNKWYEAKSGKYWDGLFEDNKRFGKFKSDMGDRLKIAHTNGATYAVYSENQIPQPIQDWFTKNGIQFTVLKK